MKIIAISLFLACFGLGSISYAYVLPSDYLLYLLAAKQQAHVDKNNKKVSDWSIWLSTEYPKSKQVIEERLYLKWPERARLVQLNGTPQQIYIENEGKAAKLDGDQMVSVKGLITDLIAQLLFPQGTSISSRSQNMIQLLEEHGINAEIVSLGRFNQEIVYIIGAKINENNTPQLWLNKSSFLPVRWVLFSEGGVEGDKIDAHLTGYASSPATNSYPNTVEIYENDELIRSAKTIDAKANQSLPETLFQLP